MKCFLSRDIICIVHISGNYSFYFKAIVLFELNVSYVMFSAITFIIYICPLPSYPYRFKVDNNAHMRDSTESI